MPIEHSKPSNLEAMLDDIWQVTHDTHSIVAGHTEALGTLKIVVADHEKRLRLYDKASAILTTSVLAVWGYIQVFGWPFKK